MKPSILFSTICLGFLSSPLNADEFSRDLEGRWNTALLNTHKSSDTFDFLGQTASIIDFFKWNRCEGGVYAGAHPTFRGGSAEAYEIARKVLVFVNSDRKPGEAEVSLEDLAVKCD
jgi:hypothetical protein